MNEGRIPANAWEQDFYELASEVLRRGAGEPVEIHRERGRLYLFLQRPALALCRYDPVAAGAGPGAPAGPRADGGEGPEVLAARAADRACADHGAIRGLLRRGARRLRHARPDGAREHLQCERRELPLPEFAAGLLALYHVDARAGVDHVRVRGACWSSSRRAGSSSSSPSAGGRRSGAAAARPRKRRAISTSSTRPTDGIPYWDTGAPNLHRLGNYLDCPADPFND